MSSLLLLLFFSLILQIHSIEIQGNCQLPDIQPIQEFDVIKPISTIKINANQYGLNINSKDNTQAINQAIQACPKQSCILTMDTGIYYFKTNPKEIQFNQLQDFTFDGNNSTLVFSSYPDIPWSRQITIRDCTKCEFKNFNFDWDWDTSPLATKVDIISADQNIWTLRFQDFSTFSKIPKQQFFKELWQSPTNNRMKSMHFWNEETQSTGANGAIEFFNIGQQASWVNVDEPNSMVTITWNNPYPFTAAPFAGATYLLKSWEYESNGFIAENCKHCSFTYNMWSSIGKGILIHHFSEYIDLNGVNVAIKPGTKRPLSVAAEAITFEGALGHIKIQNSHFTNHGDHCINVHDPFSFFGFQVLSPTSIQISQYDADYVKYEIGDQLSIRNMDLSDVGYTGNIVGLVGTILTLDKPIGWEVTSRDTSKMAIFNSKWTAGQVIIRNNECGRNRASGIRVKCSNAVVINNRIFEVMATGMYIQTGKGSNGNGEGGSNHNVAVVNNELWKVNKMNHRMGAMIIAAEIPTVNNPSAREYGSVPFMSDMLLSGNVITDSPGIAINVYSTKNVLVTNNVIQNNVWNLPQSGQIVVGAGQDITVKNNWWIGQYQPKDALIYGAKAQLGTLCLSSTQPQNQPNLKPVQDPIGLNALQPVQPVVDVGPPSPVPVVQQPGVQQPIVHTPISQLPTPIQIPQDKPITQDGHSAGVDLEKVIDKVLIVVLCLIGALLVLQSQPGRTE